MLTEITLNKKEADVLNHRLEIPEAIAEVWGPCNDNVWGIDDPHEVENRVEELIAGMIFAAPYKGMIIRFDPANEDHLRLLDEIIDGNTMQHIVTDLLDYDCQEPEYREGARWRTAMRSIDKKFEAAGLGFGFYL